MHFIPCKNLNKDKMIALCSNGIKEQKIELTDGKSFERCIEYRTTNKLLLEFLKDDLPTMEPYLFCNYSQITGGTLCIPDSLIKGGKAPSQFFRRIFAELSTDGNKFFDWKKPEEINNSKQIREKRIALTKDKFRDKQKVFEYYQNRLMSLNYNKIIKRD